MSDLPIQRLGRRILGEAEHVPAAESAQAPGPGDEIPKPEHPRPDFERAQWKNLNGAWGFCQDPDLEGLKRHPKFATLLEQLKALS